MHFITWIQKVFNPPHTLRASVQNGGSCSDVTEQWRHQIGFALIWILCNLDC